MEARPLAPIGVGTARETAAHHYERLNRRPVGGAIEDTNAADGRVDPREPAAQGP
jgi:hypothetical protein